MAHRSSVLIGSALAIVLTVGACGGGSDPKVASGNGAGTSSGGATKGGTCQPGTGKTVTVVIPEFKFDPTPVKIGRCDSVVWKNMHNQAHTSTGDGDMKWSTDGIAPGTSSPTPIQFPNAGKFTYICAFHPFMKGTVTVAG